MEISRSKTIRRSSIALAIVACFTLAACSGPGTTEAPTKANDGNTGTDAPNADTKTADRDALIAQAQADGGLNLVWGESIEGGTAAFSNLEAGFKAYYDMPDFSISYTTGPSMPQMASTIAQEVQAGQEPTSDVFIGYATHYAALEAEGFDSFEKADWSWAENVTEDSIASTGVGVVTETSIPVISYSTRVTDPPTTLAELADARFEGKIGSTPYAANFDYLGSDPMWGAEAGLTFIEGLTKNVTALNRCHNPEALTIGQYDVFAFDCDQGSIVKAKDEGEPVDYLIPSDAEMVVFIYAGIPKTSSHKAAAQLWINYMLTREAQDILWDAARTDSSLIEGSNIRAMIDEAEADGSKFSYFPMDVVVTDSVMPGADYEQRVQDLLNQIAQ